MRCHVARPTCSAAASRAVGRLCRRRRVCPGGGRAGYVGHGVLLQGRGPDLAEGTGRRRAASTGESALDSVPEGGGPYPPEPMAASYTPRRDGSLFHLDGDLLVPQVLSKGPWYEGTLH